MNSFLIKRVLKPYVSRFLPGYFLCCLVLVSCKGKTSSKKDIKIAKTVPSIYLNAMDKDLGRSNDTVYLKGQLFSGYRYTLFPAGDTAALESFFNGVEEGIQKKWFENRQLAEERFYINGKKQGAHSGWWPDGKQKFHFTAFNDEYEGEFKEWYSSGLLGKDFHYTNGHEDGSQRLWWDNGTVRANYVIKNGRKYGLIGLKTCINPYDSIYKK